MLTLAVHARVPVQRLTEMIYAYPTFHRAVEDRLWPAVMARNHPERVTLIVPRAGRHRALLAIGDVMREDLARWQFAFTSINHFLFIPITIGLAFLTALLQTVWYRRQQPEYLRLTRFFGTLLVINVAIGVVTGWCRSSSSA